MTPRLLFHSWAFLIILIALEPGCQSGTQPMQDIEQHAYTNRLIDETSPYLLQHAHNPVDWYPWGAEALDKAKEENKLILVSIGYSSCHWCHVMEHESFEDTTVAALMNERYVCIKVDREERPDIDQIYMSAVQLMTGRGGWPLNCFALPDGRPVYGGTYFPKDQWTQILNDLSETYTREPQQVESYAEKLTEGVQQSELVQLNTEQPAFDQVHLDNLVEKWSTSFDVRDGGPNRAPKFPIPNNYEFLLKHGVSRNDKAVLDHVMLTLDKIALGGIYDQIGGGFARYSTDMLWKIPHFEKMLYDNAQLIGLYSQAFQVNSRELYQQRVEETIEFVERELMSADGAFYSALDADSEGEEGKFYVFTKQELDSLLGEDVDLAINLFNVNRKGLWEHGNYILLRTEDDEEFVRKEGLERSAFDQAKNRITAKLMEARNNRTRPGLDDKSLVSWNALMISGLSKAYAAFGRKDWLELAERNLSLILTKCKRGDGGLNHNYKAGNSSINGYLEDYAFLIEALIDLYEVTFNEEYLNEALSLTDYAVAHFLDEQTGMFYFTSDIDPPLIARKHEITDNVIPASNSSMAKNLFRLGHLYFKEDFLKMSERMLNNVQADMESYPPGYSNWAILMMGHTQPFHEIAITGNQALTKRIEFGQHFIPNRVFLGGTSGNLPLLDGKFFDETTIFVCQNRTCQLPVSTVEEALRQLQ